MPDQYRTHQVQVRELILGTPWFLDAPYSKDKNSDGILELSPELIDQRKFLDSTSKIRRQKSRFPGQEVADSGYFGERNSLESPQKFMKKIGFSALSIGCRLSKISTFEGYLNSC